MGNDDSFCVGPNGACSQCYQEPCTCPTAPPTAAHVEMLRSRVLARKSSKHQSGKHRCVQAGGCFTSARSLFAWLWARLTNSGKSGIGLVVMGDSPNDTPAVAVVQQAMDHARAEALTEAKAACRRIAEIEATEHPGEGIGCGDGAEAALMCAATIGAMLGDDGSMEAMAEVEAARAREAAESTAAIKAVVEALMLAKRTWGSTRIIGTSAWLNFVDAMDAALALAESAGLAGTSPALEEVVCKLDDVVCKICDGKGKRWRDCFDCQGSGRGLLVRRRKIPTCDGSGRLPCSAGCSHPCRGCDACNNASSEVTRE